MHLFEIILSKTILFLFYIAIGYILAKTGVLNNKRGTLLNSILLKFIIPCVLINAFQDKSLFENPGIFYKGLLYTGIVQVLLIVLSILFFSKDIKDYKTRRLCVSFLNVGFMGIPLLSSIYGNEGAIYGGIATLYLHAFLWTYGSVSLSKKLSPELIIKNLKRPIIISLIISIILFAFRITLPEIIIKPVSLVASVNSPCAMICSGYLFSKYSIKKYFSREIIETTAVRNIFISGIIVLLCRMTGIRDTALYSAAILACCPTATVVPIMISENKQNSALSTGVFVLSTVFCIFTIPLMSLLLG